MKKYILSLTILAGLSPLALQAQSQYTASQFSQYDLNGTARYVGMGGAMGALGADMSTMDTNPAGLGLFRSSEFAMTASLVNTNVDSYTNDVNKFRGSFDNIGFVFANKQSNIEPLRFFNFGINVYRQSNWDKTLSSSSTFYGASQTDQMAHQVGPHQYANGNTIGGLYPNALDAPNFVDNENIPFLGALGWKGSLIEENPAGSQEYRSLISHVNDQAQTIYSNYWGERKGGIYAIDFGLGFNIYDQVYFGASLGIKDVDTEFHSQYQEQLQGDPSKYTLDTWETTTGTGVDFKIGMIVRPVLESPLRLGFAIHTPTFYKLKTLSSAKIQSDMDMNLDGQITDDELFDYDTTYFYDNNGRRVIVGDMTTKRELYTPWRYNFSLGYTVGREVAIGLEYEYADYSQSSLRYDNGEKMIEENQLIDQYMKGVSTFKLGIEWRAAPGLALRAGYNYITPVVKESSRRSLAINSIETDTSWENMKEQYNYTLGLGYKWTNSFYTDFAYQFNTYKTDFYAFNADGVTANELTHNRNKFMATFGFKF